MDPSVPYECRRSVGAPPTVGDLLDFDFIELGHVTASVFIDSVRSQGLLPNNHSGHCINDGLESSPDLVYLLAKYDPLYAKRAVEAFGGNAVVFSVRVPIKNLVADQNALAPAACFESDLKALFHSLCFGVCAHRGPIHVSQILNVRDLSGRSVW